VGFDAAMTRVFVEGKSPDGLSLRSSLLDTSSGRVLHEVDSLHGNGRAMTSDGRWAAAENRSDGGGSSVRPARVQCLGDRDGEARGLHGSGSQQGDHRDGFQPRRGSPRDGRASMRLHASGTRPSGRRPLALRMPAR
jgi:hypothetical protein